ncbi:MAG: rhomboid family intramembrane serine protease [bacterium]|nr:rhomboid family intramembrane serine protease [bacterium]
MKAIFYLFIVFSLVLLGIFFIVSQAVTILGFSGESFFGGEIWRILSYPLAHVGISHLLENLVALFIVILLSYELNLSMKEFTLVFLLSGILVAIFSGILFPYLLIVGSSLGIYSIFGALALKDQEIMPQYLFLGIFGIIIFLNAAYTIYTSNDYTQSAYHAAGFISGAALISVRKLRRKKRILQ